MTFYPPQAFPNQKQNKITNYLGVCLPFGILAYFLGWRTAFCPPHTTHFPPPRLCMSSYIRWKGHPLRPLTKERLGYWHTGNRWTMGSNLPLPENSSASLPLYCESRGEIREILQKPGTKVHRESLKKQTSTHLDPVKIWYTRSKSRENSKK